MDIFKKLMFLKLRTIKCKTFVNDEKYCEKACILPKKWYIIR